ncbi:MAG: PEP-CTERM sorting domain-containing protein [Bryobacterales bacterium]|nr:PEP-CTERM sorting domain-containing protein [Bryobacterales bacterium]
MLNRHSRALAVTALSIVTIAGGGSLTAAPMITPTGLNSGQAAVSSLQAAAVSWTLASAWTDVTISASLITEWGDERTGEAFLMNQIGPGTTVANQIASTPFTFATVPTLIGNEVFVQLFSGLTLDAGTYYLVFASSASSTWIATTSLPYNTAPGVSVGTPYFASSSNLDTGFAPASTFSVSNAPRYFSLTGTPAGSEPDPDPDPGPDPNPVPEPSSTLLIAGGLLAWAFRRRAIASSGR